MQWFSRSFGSLIFSNMFNDYSLLLRIIYKGIIIASFPFILYLIRFYEPVELDRIRGSSKKMEQENFALGNKNLNMAYRT